MDVLGRLHQIADERPDPIWQFPSEEKAIKEQKDVAKLEEVISQIDLGLEGSRKKLLAPNSEEG